MTLDYRPYRPLRSGERYCPACGADTLRREPDGTVYYVGHSEANCYKRQLSQALAEAERWRKQYEALRPRVASLADEIGESAREAWRQWDADADRGQWGRAVGLEQAEQMVRRLLAEVGGGSQ